MNKAGGENHASREGLCSNKEAAVCTKETALLSNERDSDANYASEKNRGDGNEFEDECGRVVSASFNFGG